MLISGKVRSARNAILPRGLCSLAFLAAVTFVVAVPDAMAFKLSPSGTAFEKAVAKKYANTWERWMSRVTGLGVELFTESVHEEITHRIFDCEGGEDVCGDPDIGYATQYVLAGVRWNDDPPFRLEEGEGRGTSCKTVETIRFTTQPVCWAELFKDAKGKAKRGMALNGANRSSLLARSHFGDLQFLHAMAERDGEVAAETRRRIFMWAEFTWRVSMGEFGLSTRLKEIPVDGMQEFFGSTDWRVQDLFTLGNPALRRHVDEVAFGSLLHMVEDSFAKGHAQREEGAAGEKCPGTGNLPAPGRVMEFHAYGRQDGGAHAKYDSRNLFTTHWASERPHVIDVGRALRDLWERDAPWAETRSYLECVFALTDPNAKASPGTDFRAND